jgi:hypothetical protein
VKKVLVIHFNQWGDTMLYRTHDATPEQLQLIRDSQFTEEEAQSQSEATLALDTLLEDDWKYNYMGFGPWDEMTDVDLVLFCGTTKGPLYDRTD